MDFTMITDVVVDIDPDTPITDVVYLSPVEAGAYGYLELYSSEIVDSFTEDKLRKAIGNTVYISRPAGNTTQGKFVMRPNHPRSEEDLRELNISNIRPVASQIYKMEANSARITAINASLHIPNVKIPFRLYADVDNIQGDIYWREYFVGGSFAGIDFDNLVDTSRIYYDIAIDFKMPMNYKTKRSYELLLRTPPGPVSICEAKANYLDYNTLVQNYQEWASELSSELLIPNYYINALKLYEDNARDLEDEDVVMSMQMGWTKQRENVFNYHFSPAVDPLQNVNYDETTKDQYYGSHFININIKEEYKNAALKHQQNLIFDNEYFKWTLSTGDDPSGLPKDMDTALSDMSLDINEKLSTFYNIKINFDRHIIANGEFDPGDVVTRPSLTELLEDSLEQPSINPFAGFTENLAFSSYKILEILKDVDEGTITDLPRRNQSFNYSNNYDVASYVDGVPTAPFTEINELLNETISLKTINFIQFLTYAFNNYNVALNDNFLFMGPENASHAATMATDTLYRNKNSQQLLRSIDRAFDMTNFYFHLLTQVLGGEHIGDGSAGTTGFEPLEFFGHDELNEDIFKRIISPTKKFYEVLAYKIEKIGGAPTGDDSNQNIIQKFWVYNSLTTPNQISITDSQVKYGEKYTYKISAYALVMSHKYKYADFRLTKQIGTGQKFDPDDDTETAKFCVQFYNPATDEVASQLFSTATPDESSFSADVMKSVLAGQNELASSEVDVSIHPQLADFHLMIEPCLELIEIPFYQKTVKVLDSPPNAINVIPFHFIDDSNRVGFKIGQDSYIDRTYPENITINDSVLQSQYLNSREILSVQKITEPSQSPARFIEMYRITQKPNSFTDFADALVATIDLRIHGGVHNFRDHITADKITPNRKYYYIFRLLNENKIPGPLSQIIECELVNDGGYVYSLFDTVDSSEFSPNKITTNSKAFKKLMQLEPHINQMVFDTSEMNFNGYASDEVGNLKIGIADESMWDKKFKVRLTSKKTGKKIDLNTTFNLRTRDLTKLSESMLPPASIPPPSEDPPTLPVLDEDPSVEVIPLSEPFFGTPADGGGPDTGAGTGAVLAGAVIAGKDETEATISDPAHERYRITVSQYAYAADPKNQVQQAHRKLFVDYGGPIPRPIHPSDTKHASNYIKYLLEILFAFRRSERILTHINADDAVAIIGGIVGLKSFEGWGDEFDYDGYHLAGIGPLIGEGFIREILEKHYPAKMW